MNQCMLRFELVTFPINNIILPLFILYKKNLSILGYGRKEVVDILLMAGANVHARDDGGLIPLHNACSFGHAEVIFLMALILPCTIYKGGRGSETFA